MPTTHMVPARDGVRMATDVYLPDGAGPFPVIMERTPYGRHLASRSEITAANPTPASRAEIAAGFTAHGYAVVYQDTRGRYGSEGRFIKYLSDAEDGFDTCAWLRAQPWCDGRICTMGLSYAAHTQAALACLDPPGLVAQVLDCGGFANAWQAGIRQSGAFELKQATWAYRNALTSPEAEADPVMRAALEAEDIARVVHPHAVAPRALAVAPSSRLRSLSVRAMDARRVRCVLAATRHLDAGILCPLFARRLRAHVVLVGPVSADGDCELHRVETGRAGGATIDPRAMEARRPFRPLFRRRRVRTETRRSTPGRATGAPIGGASSITS